jgi:hypothetical protein
MEDVFNGRGFLMEDVSYWKMFLIGMLFPNGRCFLLEDVFNGRCFLMEDVS